MGDFVFTLALNTVFGVINNSIKNPKSEKAVRLAHQLSVLYDQLGILIARFKQESVLV